MTKGMLPGLGVAFALAFTASAASAVVKTKTKSNQSNDRCAGTCPVLRDEVAAGLEAEFDRLDADKDGQLGTGEQGGIAVSPAGGETARGARSRAWTSVSDTRHRLSCGSHSRRVSTATATDWSAARNGLPTASPNSTWPMRTRTIR